MSPEEAIIKVASLSAMLLVMVGVATLLGLIGGMAAMIILGTVAISLLLIPIAGIAAILTLMKDMSPEEAIIKVLALSTMLTVMVTVATLLGIIGVMTPLIVLGTAAVMLIVALLPTIGSGLGKFMSNIGTFGDAQLATVKCAVNAFVVMSEAFQNVVPDSLFAFFGAGQFKTFINELPHTATQIAAFVANLGTFSDAQVATVTSATTAVKNMAQAFDGVTPDSLFEFFGNNKFEKFLKNLPTFAEHMNKFMEKMKSFDSSTINSVNAAVGAVKALTALKNVDVDSLNQKMSGFGDGMIDFAGKINSFISKLNEVGGGAISTATSNISTLVTTCQKMENVNADTIANFGTALGSLGEADVKSFVNAVNGASEAVITAGENLVKNLATGAESQNDTTAGKIKTVAENAATAAKEKYQSFYNAGSHLVSGFAAGISENDYKATAKARAMAKAAAAAAEEALDINSPSKVFKAIGTSIPEGFAMGIDKLSGMVTASSVSMADDAVFTVTDSVSRISDMIDSDIDTQPTIRPVLDLSEIKAGASGIDGLFDTRASVGLMSNINAISSSMGRQNGTNDELISEIRALRKDFGGVKSDTYNINGITYDDGSNITEAVQTIVRAARIERRT